MPACSTRTWRQKIYCFQISLIDYVHVIHILFLYKRQKRGWSSKLTGNCRNYKINGKFYEKLMHFVNCIHLLVKITQRKYHTQQDKFLRNLHYKPNEKKLLPTCCFIDSVPNKLSRAYKKVIKNRF